MQSAEESAQAAGSEDYLAGDTRDLATDISITALRPRGPRGATFTVELSNGEILRLQAETVARRGLNVGDVVDSAAILAWQREDSFRRAVEAGLNYVSFRPRSNKEVTDHLHKKSFDSAACDHALHRLAELGYVDDAAFARFWVESRDSFRPRGRRALAWELRRKGVDDAIIEDTLDRFAGNESCLARAAARKRAATLATDDALKFRRSLGSFLARRGFGYEVIGQVVNEIWEEQGTDNPHCDEAD